MPEPDLTGVGLFASDAGPRATLNCLAGFGARWIRSASGLRLLVIGTSQSESGAVDESRIHEQAARLDVPVVCIEDFPGNFTLRPGLSPRLLVVEGSFSIRLYRSRLGADAPAMFAIPPARYDPLRGRGRPPEAEHAPAPVLWAGQPETDACLATLRAVLPVILRHDVQLLLRAHPRDSGHADGAYRDLLAQLPDRVLDVTGRPMDEVYAMHPRLVITQYSSLAIEAGFLGIPSAMVLLPDAGARLLRAQKGYRVPMPVEAGAVLGVMRRRDLGRLAELLHDTRLRQELQRRFGRLYRTSTPQAARLAHRLARAVLL